MKRPTRIILLLTMLLSATAASADLPDSTNVAPADTTAVDSISPPRRGAALNESDGGFAPAMTLDALVTLPSPEAAAMTRHIDDDVDYASGTAGLHVPLFSWTAGDIAMSLSLDHFIGPHRVDEQPGWVGLGWNLSGAGCVTRQIVGLPDEASAPYIRSKGEITSDPDGWKYLIDIDELRKEASLDRYIYSCPGASGSFVVVNGSIVQTPLTDNEITFTGNQTDGVRDFMVTTPDGTRYIFAEREYIDFRYEVLPTPAYNRSPHYDNAVSTWHLSRIVSPEGADTVTYAYDTLPQWSRQKNHNNVSYSIIWDDVSGEATYGGSDISAIGPYALTTFRGQKVLRTLTSPTATVTFNRQTVAYANNFATPALLTGITVAAPDGTSVRDISLEYNYSNKMRNLTRIEIRSDGNLLDAHDFSYCPWQYGAAKDFFGYPNYKNSIGNSPVIDPETGKFNDLRTHDTRRQPRKGELRLHTTATGLRTAYTYEPSAMTYVRRDGTGAPIDTFTLAIGSRLKKIEIVDSVTGRRRLREFSYADPMCTVDFDKVGFGDFVSIEGSRKISNDMPTNPLFFINRYSTQISFHESSLAPGAGVENARIYYGSVEERISGTDVTTPVLTRYGYDTDHCRAEFIPAVQGNDSPLPGDSDGDRFLASFRLPFNAPEGLQTAASGFASIEGSFTETCGVRPLLTSVTTFSGSGSTYLPLAERRYSYTVVDQATLQTAVTTRKRVRDVINATGVPKHDCRDLSELDFCTASLHSSRALCDTIVTTRHFPDGEQRTSTTSNIYAALGIPLNTNAETSAIGNNDFTPTGPVATASPFPGDSILMIASYRMPVGTRTEAGGHVTEHYTARADNVCKPFFDAARSRGRRSLPVVEMWVVDGRDTITRSWEYGMFHGVTRPTAITLRGRRGALMARQIITGYTPQGCPSGVKERGAPPRYFTWGYGGRLLTSVTEGHADGPQLTTSFTHLPLVGCTSVTSPNGSVTRYTYSGGRLASVIDGEGVVIAKYDYGLRADCGDNRIAVTNYLNSRLQLGAGSVTETLYDGFGLLAAEIGRGYGSDGTDVATVTRHDALHRPSAQWGPLPLSDTAEALLSDTPLSAASAALYGGDPAARTLYAYRAAAEETPASVTGPGSDFRGASTHFELTTSTTQMRDYARAVVRFEFDGNTLTAAGYYLRGELDCERVTDPDGHVTLTFTDVLGRTVLVRRLTDNYSYADTYTVSDSWGNPLIVLPPEASAALSVTGLSWTLDDPTLDRYAFVYTYDDAMRLRSARQPGRAAVRYAYDSDGLLAFTRDGNQSAAGRRSFIMRDPLGRIAVTGICDDALDDAIWDSDLSASTLPLTVRRTATVGSGLAATGYTSAGNGSQASSLQGTRMLTATYYDDTDFLTPQAKTLFDPPFVAAAATPAADPDGSATFPAYHPVQPAQSSAGLTTGHLESLEGDSADIAGALPLLTVSRYSLAGHLIRSVAREADGSVVTTSVTPSCGGLPLVTMVVTAAPDGTELRRSRTTSSYDSFGRLVRSTLLLGDSPADSAMLLADISYDAIGRPCQQKAQGDFRHVTERDIRGNVSRWQAAGIEQHLLYGDQGSYISFSGRVTGKTTTAPGGGERRYDYAYSPLGFLTKADFSDSSRPSTDYSALYEYDRQANLTKITRRGQTFSGLRGASTLEITLDGNRISSTKAVSQLMPMEPAPLFGEGSLPIEDGPISSFFKTRHYDANGNLTFDPDRKINHIGYNAIDRPQKIRFGSGDEIRYVYSASGRKVAERQISADGLSDRTRRWVGDCEITEGAAPRLLLPQGYVDLGDDGGSLHLYVADVQGNVVGVYGCDSRSLEQFTDYYPYGTPHPDAQSAELQRRKFGGKELLSEFGLAEYDFDARRLIGSVGSFSQPDPLASLYSWFSPYSYCAGDPINLIDPSGLGWLHCHETDEIIWDDNVNNNNETPEGHTFIGNDNQDIVKYLGYKSSFDSKMFTHWYFGVDGDERLSVSRDGGVYRGFFGIILIGSHNYSYLFKINPRIISGMPTINNANGLYFGGINIYLGIKIYGVSRLPFTYYGEVRNLEDGYPFKFIIRPFSPNDNKNGYIFETDTTTLSLSFIISSDRPNGSRSPSVGLFNSFNGLIFELGAANPNIFHFPISKTIDLK